MRAITWSSTFDLSKRLNDVTAELNEFNWALDSDTVVKCVATMMGLSVASEALVELRNQDERKLHAAFNELPAIVKRTADFLHEHFGIRSPDVVSYQGQILLAFMLTHQGTIDEVREQFIKWFWACGLNEQLQGKPDTYVSRLLSDWSHPRQEKSLSTSVQASFNHRDFLVRPLRGGAALTNSFRMVLARTKARDLCSGIEIPSAEYLSGSSTSQFMGVLSKDDASAALNSTISSSKLFSNSVLVSLDHETFPIDVKQFIINALAADNLEILESQLITVEAAQALALGDHRSFLSTRAMSILEYCQGILK